MSGEKINATGIVAEYNPFHNGHQYHIKETRKKTGGAPIVAIMSGNFVQRGEPAAFDKYVRTHMALLGGADLVIELPTIFAVGGAEAFAAGAVAIMKGLGINRISFGSESCDVERMRAVAEILATEPPEFKAALKTGMDEGLSFVKARSIACNIALGEEDITTRQESNDLLATEYIRQIILEKADIELLPIKRTDSGYLDAKLPRSGKFASASAIRNEMPYMLELAPFTEISRFMPPSTSQLIENLNTKFKCILNDFFPIIASKVLSSKEEELSEYLGGGEGLTQKLINEIRKADNIDALTGAMLSKRYTVGRIQRLYMSILLGIKEKEFRDLSDAFVYGKSGYARVLGFDRVGSKLLKEIKKSDSCTIPIITNINKERELFDEKAARILEFDIFATDMFNLAKDRNLYDESDFTMRPIMI